MLSASSTEGVAGSPPSERDVLGGEVLERERGIEVAEGVGDDVVHGVVDHRRVGARRRSTLAAHERLFDESRDHVAHSNRSLPRHEPERYDTPTRCPSAAAASDGSRRSPTGRSKSTPRKVLLDAESSSGAPSPASTVGVAEELQRLGGRLAEVQARVDEITCPRPEPGVEGPAGADRAGSRPRLR